MNLIIIGGIIVDGPELKNTNYGDVLKFTILATEPYLDKDGNERLKKEYIKCAMYGGRVAYWGKKLSKDAKVYCEGSLRTMKYNSGEEVKYYTYVAVNKIIPDIQTKTETPFEDKLFSSKTPSFDDTEEIPF